MDSPIFVGRQPILDRDEKLRIADSVKVGPTEIPRNKWCSVVRHLRKRELTLLAEKIETREDFEECMKFGFDLFQGYLFAVSKVLECDGVDRMLADLGIDVPTLQDCENRTDAWVHGLSVSE